MPVVISLQECLARPTQLLIDHLESVAKVCGGADGSFEERLAFLAGLAHDAAKATVGWQFYIRGGSKKGPPHAPTGAALFAFWAESLISTWTPDRRERLLDLAMEWVRVIDHHHGAFDDLSDRPPWDGNTTPPEHEPSALLATCDLDGLDALIRKYFPEMQASLNSFDDWGENFEKSKTWPRQSKARHGLCTNSVREKTIDSFGLRMAELGARLIYADRLHAAEWKPVSFLASQAEIALQHYEEHCRKETDSARRNGVSEDLLKARQHWQLQALKGYQNQAVSYMFTLLLPTGYGKTLAGLRVALEAIQSKRCRRILYVAPYISILSQAASVLEEATGMRVVLHHQMSILNLSNANPGSYVSGSEDVQAEDHQPYDLLDTWQAPIIATTFNQLFRALFPARAQQCLRIPALDEAFIFIDEPQIIDPPVWSAFLRAMAVVAHQRRSQVLFCTATLPPINDGLGDHGPALPLVESFPPAISRFTIRSISGPWDSDRVAHEARSRLRSHGNVAVILNTVRDAYDVFRKLNSPEHRWFFLASRMLPGHKERIILRIRKFLKNRLSIGVVCTQVLEAGVNLSFCSILRARSTIASIVQTAGRANRHGEGKPAEVIVFPFVRDDGQDPRKWVYKDCDARRFTDEILDRNPEILETNVAGLLDEYYKKCWAANSHGTSLQDFDSAARGKWSALAEKEPFGEDVPGLDVFIPGAERFLPRRYQLLLKRFGADTAKHLLRQYLDRDYRRSLSFKERRLQSALLRQFLVDVPKARANEIAHPLNGTPWPLVLDNPNLYRKSTGLAHLLAQDRNTDGTQVF